MSAKTLIVPPDVHPAIGYAHAYRVGGTIYCAGQVALDIDRNLVGKGDFEAQCVQTYENLRRVLAAAGATMDDVVKTTVFLTDLEHLPILRAVRTRFFGDPGPAGTLLVVKSLANPDYLIELEAIAVVSG
ncbi:MAG: enamine deaminase RidA [Dehalococcoidia bacterium]|nr:MAG: enamine deaminase RidA [Dehalococcoidia bacterium]